MPGKGREQWEVIPRQEEVSIGDNNNILELGSGDIGIIFSMCQTTTMYNFKSECYSVSTQIIKENAYRLFLSREIAPCLNNNEER